MMQAALPKWKSSFILTKVTVKSATNSIEIPHFAYFHSTAPSLEKWKPKWNNSDARGCEQPAKDALFCNGFPNISSKPFPEMNERWEEQEGDHSNRKPRSKASVRRDSRGMKAKRQLKQRREKFFEQFDANPNIFQATFGNKWYTWAFRSGEDPPSQSSTGFDWREGSQWGRRKLNESDLESESDCEPCNVGKDSDRLVLGLPAKGPLKIDDVKNAFRLAALKWHPDRHQGLSQASTEEKFKRCVDAYKSLSDALPKS
ncbi:hypothetical protein Leryth_002013 [Lithospermum erythrorhizon]|nr:hypothetical protein Leryth_002013 [Lithospermum erythrorhizon]